MNAGPCPECGDALSVDQRYCVSCGYRVEAPLAPSYLPAPLDDVGERGSAGRVFPIPIPVATTFAAVALGFGVVLGTAISPNLSGLVAGEHIDGPTVAQAPAPAPEPKAKGGGSAEPAPAIGTSTGSSFYGSSGSSYGSGGVDSDTGGKKKKKPKEKLTYLSGTVVHKNPVAGSYAISSGGGLSAIHAKTLPAPGTKVKVPIRILANGTYAEDGKRQAQGQVTQAKFTGVVTDTRDSIIPAVLDVYTVSGLGASVLVHSPEDPSGLALPPEIGTLVTTTVEIKATAPTQPPAITPPVACIPPVVALPTPPIVPAKELFQTAIVTSPVPIATTQIETVVQTTCVGAPGAAVLSSDDIREAQADVELEAASGIDLARLAAGQPIIASVRIEPLGIGGSNILTVLTGTASDLGIKGADDNATSQGDLARVARISARKIERAATRAARAKR